MYSIKIFNLVTSIVDTTVFFHNEVSDETIHY